MKKMSLVFQGGNGRSRRNVWSLPGRLFIGIAALLHGGCDDRVADADAGPGPSFEEFKSRIYEEPGTGIYVYNGDEVAQSLDELREVYDSHVAGGDVGVLKRGLSVYSLSGVDVKWSAAQALNLTYCVSTAFGPRYGAVVQALEQATWAWEGVAQVNFIHLSSQDSTCDTSNNGVLFDVRPVSNQPYLARAFFPNASRAGRNVLIDTSSFGNTAPYTLAGIMRHELGHVLGFRHEHTRPEAGTCFEDGDWRALSPYDAASVMHYPQCNGTNPGDLTLTYHDRSGASSLYGGRYLIAVSDAGLYWRGAIGPGAGSDWAWVGEAYGVTAMTSFNGSLYVTSGNHLFRRGGIGPGTGNDWMVVGEANGVTAMASFNGALYATSGNFLYKRGAIGPGTGNDWTVVGEANGVTAMASFNGALYATSGNFLYKRGAIGPGTGNDWTIVGEAYDVVGLASMNP